MYPPHLGTSPVKDANIFFLDDSIATINFLANEKHNWTQRPQRGCG